MPIYYFVISLWWFLQLSSWRFLNSKIKKLGIQKDDINHYQQITKSRFNNSIVELNKTEEKYDLNIVIQRDELINFDLRKYISSSFLNATYDIYDITNGSSIVIEPNKVFNITLPYSLIDTNKFDMSDTAVPMKRNMLLINVNEVDQRNKNYLFYIDEEYKIIIDRPDFFKMDLKPVISNFISPITYF